MLSTILLTCALERVGKVHTTNFHLPVSRYAELNRSPDILTTETVIPIELRDKNDTLHIVISLNIHRFSIYGR